MTELFVKEKSIGMGNLTIDNQDFGNVEYEVSLKRPATKNEQIAYYLSKLYNVYMNTSVYDCRKCPFGEDCPIPFRQCDIIKYVMKDKTFIEE